MFERYTQETRRVIFWGRNEASVSGAGMIESEHLLLGLLCEDREMARRFFGSPDANLVIRPRVALKFRNTPAVPVQVDMPVSQAASQVLENAAGEAAALKHVQIAPAHILLALLRDKESLAAEILNEHGVTADEVRRYLSEPAAKGTLSPPEGAANGAMMQMICNFWISRALYTAAKLGIADLVKHGPKTAADLAAATGSHPAFLHRMLRALASVGVFHEMDSQRFAITPLSETLLTDRPGTMRYFAMAELGQEHFSAWEEFPYSIRTGGLAFTEKFKQPVWEYYAAHAEHAETFNKSMSTLTESVTAAVLAAYDFKPFHKIVEIGGGEGAFLAAMLGAAAPSARGVLFDAPAVIAKASRLHQADLSGRTEQIAGNFFEAVPAGGDLYTMKMILHDWTDEESIAILKNIRTVIAPGGKVVIVELVLGQGPDIVYKNFLDLNMMVMTGGCERTGPEFQHLLEKSGFKFSRVIPTGSAMSLIEGTAG